MLPVEQLSDIPLFFDLPQYHLSALAEHASNTSIARNDYLIRQHDRAQWLFFLRSGRVQFLMEFAGAEPLLVGIEYLPGALIGWSAFRPPYRYTVSVRCEQDCEFLVLEAEAVTDVFKRDPLVAFNILERVSEVLAERFESARELLLTPGN